MKKLDRIDIGILNRLQEDATVSYTHLRAHET